MFKQISILSLIAFFLSCAYQTEPFIPGTVDDSAITPWDKAELMRDASDFQFLIVSDRTGGMRPGVFAESIPKINALHPEFVISVGDLIDGYSTDSLYLDGQWQEFESILSGLERPFFRVPGNHDISNIWMANDWQRRYGPQYYHFVYKDVLFLVLNTDEDGMYGIRGEQIAYTRKVLADNQLVRWTMIFMHRPIWGYGDQAGYEHIEALLEDRPYTVFSGHHHHYKKSERNGRDHYVLATTGGGSYMRGPELGEFDHVTWVSMTEKGPDVVNLTLDGIISDDVVTEDDVPTVQALRLGSWIQVAPILAEGQSFEVSTMRLILSNPGDRPLKIMGEISSQHLRFSPTIVDRILEPLVQDTLNLNIVNHTGISIQNLRNIQPFIELTASAELKPESWTSIPNRFDLTFDAPYPLSFVQSPKTIDGSLADWNSEIFIADEAPGYLNEDWDWHGPQDGRYRFALLQDDEAYYLALDLHDDIKVLDKIISPEIQDHITLYFNSQHDFDNSDHQFSINIEFDETGQMMAQDSSLINEMNIQAISHTDGFTMELKLMKTEIGTLTRFNLAFTDQDRATNGKPSRLWWRPPWGSEQDYSNSGTFYSQGAE